MDLVSADSCEFQQPTLSWFLHDSNIVELVKSAARCFKLAHLVVPNTYCAFSEVTDRYHVLVCVVQSHCLHTSWMELKLLLDCEIQT